QLDLLRVLALFQKSLEVEDGLKQAIAAYLLKDFPGQDRDARWEQVRLLGEYQFPAGFPKLLALLESERDEVTQFHIAQAISRIPGGWKKDEEERLLRWMLATQKGWFAQFDGKGVSSRFFCKRCLPTSANTTGRF